jgi:hypothetical protein
MGKLHQHLLLCAETCQLGAVAASMQETRVAHLLLLLMVLLLGLADVQLQLR